MSMTSLLTPWLLYYKHIKMLTFFLDRTVYILEVHLLASECMCVSIECQGFEYVSVSVAIFILFEVVFMETLK